MSIRTYGIFNNTSSSGNKGYPTADVSNIILRSLSGLRAGIRWTDPENTMVDNAVLSEWYSTIIVRKDGSVPESIEDGVLVIESTTRNQYQEIEYIDQNGLEEGHVYYYRFFTKSIAGVIGDGSPTVKMTAKKVSTVLAENDWATIIEVAESGAAPQTWKIGDEISITLTNGETMTMQIWAFDRYDKADGSGKAAITFGTKNLMKSVREVTIPSWEDTPADNVQDIALWIDTILPAEIINSVKLVTVNSGDNGSNIVTQNKVFIPALGELGLSHFTSSDEEFPAFSIFTDNNSRIKKLANGAGEAEDYFTRTMQYSPYNGDRSIMAIRSTGDWFYMDPSWSAGVCFLFNI